MDIDIRIRRDAWLTIKDSHPIYFTQSDKTLTG